MNIWEKCFLTAYYISFYVIFTGNNQTIINISKAMHNMNTWKRWWFWLNIEKVNNDLKQEI